MRPKGEQELRMVWKASRGDKTAFFVGTAHFFPYSFRLSFEKLMAMVERVVFEGPLDPRSMARVAEAGRGYRGSVIDALSEAEVEDLYEVLFPGRRLRRLQQLLKGPPRQELSRMVEGMKPWFAFFSLWSAFLRARGWTRSVDLEAHAIALELNKEVHYLETIEEQIEVLEALPEERILSFLREASRWPHYCENYLRYYLEGDVEGLKAASSLFPSRDQGVIEDRDERFLQRLGPFLDRGGVLVCVGAPHLVGMFKGLCSSGFRVERFALGNL